ncbi:Saccharopine dehydrogenase [Prunus dulcis]|uniref:Saccharopine dehydrogenase n=1 Tax=Prunus dulcis TaxID=3755 RepID=A0A5H2XMN7_PRUDU|nr:Saccharopine dehydrogenase [Prunus dulcis]
MFLLTFKFQLSAPNLLLSFNHARTPTQHPQPSLRSDNPWSLRLHRQVRCQRSSEIPQHTSSPLKSLALAGRSPTKLTRPSNGQLTQTRHRPFPSSPPTPPNHHRSTASAPKPNLSSTAWGPFASTASRWWPLAPKLAAITWIYVESLSSWRGWRLSTMTGPWRSWVDPALPNRVEAYVSLESEKRIVGNFGTFESAVLRAQAVQTQKTKACDSWTPPPKGPTIEQQKDIGLWAVKLPSADAIVVRRTLGVLTENPRGLPGSNESAEHIEKREAFWSTVKPVHFGVKIGSKSLLGILHIMTVGIFIGLLGRFSFGRWLLLKFPSFFSVGWFRKKGPSEDEVRSASFKMWFVGKGFSDSSLVSQGNRKPDMEIITRVMGPEIGYLTTPIILLQCALILLHQRNNLPKGGVFPPGIVFGPTDLQERLQENGISFDVISKKAISS